MLLTLVETPPEGEDWIHEVKYDGYRTLVAVDGAHTQAFTRNGHDWTSKNAPIVHEAACLKCDTAVLDGEMIVQNQDGISDFGALRGAIRSDPERLILYCFDLLMLNGRDLRGLALTDRRRRLQDLVGNHPESRIHFSEELVGNGLAAFPQPSAWASRALSRSAQRAATCPASARSYGRRPKPS
jgi:ATP-dependent DNA ligase